jgi:hypothetical protein
LTADAPESAIAICVPSGKELISVRRTLFLPIAYCAIDPLLS